jgi:predicted DNA-binding transcriptional regulator YafY
MNIESKLRPLYLAKILLSQTDDEHSLTTNELSEILEREYHISAHRTTIGEDIKVLAQAGLDVDTIKSTQNRFRILSRDFDIAELKLLIDAVESSKFITEKRSDTLIEKLQRQASIHSAEALKRNLRACSHFKPDNEEVIYIADTVNAAINAGKKISFQYFDYNARKEKELRNGGSAYSFSPYYLIWDGDCYYMVGYSDKHHNIGNFRMDRVYQQPTILSEDAVPVPSDFDINEYVATSFRMYNSERRKVELICDNSTMDAMLDRFGMEVETRENDAESFLAVVNVAVSHVFYAWVFGFGGKVKIKGPEDVRAGYAAILCEAEKAIQ